MKKIIQASVFALICVSSLSSQNLSEMNSLSVTNLKGEATSIELKNKITLIVFWATWCSPCKDEMPELQKLSDSFHENRFQIIGINVGTSKVKAQQFIKNLNVKFKNFIDTDEKLSDQFEVSALPFTLLIDHRSKSIHQFQGYFPEDINKYKKLIQKYLLRNKNENYNTKKNTN